MSNARHDRLEEIFSAALQRETAAERSAFLDGVCGADVELRGQVDALLAAHDRAGEFLDSPIFDPDATVVRSLPGPEGPGTRIGRYKILQSIGEGGFGSVHMAEQEEPVRRKVALKIIKLGMDTKQVIARFEAERQALALMDHPNIARVLDAGATDTGRPYFVMELVRGIRITDYCDQNRLTTRARLELFIQVCRAVQHAHQKGIIHRDLKPGNVLVTLHDGVPVPKVIDFGIAKATSQRLTDKTLFTEFRQFIGTPEYMSPDQAAISGLDVDTRTDIYSLGVLLYELLTGTTPFDAQALRRAPDDEIRRIIREVEPPKPSTRAHTLSQSRPGTADAGLRQAEAAALSRSIRGELDWIVMKAMEKDRTRRYDTASDLANDVQRYLNNEPVLAGPPSTCYRVRKFVSRNRAPVLASALVVAALVGGLAMATTFYLRASAERDAAQLAKARADQEAARSQRIADFLQELLVSTDPDQAIAHNLDVARIEATAREVFGEDHATVAATLGSRALQLQSAGALELAERLYRESLRIWRERGGDNNINVAATLRALGILQLSKGDDRAAEQTFRESIRITRALPNPESITLAETLALLAGVLGNRGAYAEAVDLLRESIRMRRTAAPQQRLQVAITSSSLANMLMLGGHETEFAELIPELLATWRQALPAGSPALGRVLTELARFHLNRNDLASAEPLLREALEIFMAAPDPSVTHACAALRGLAVVLERRDDPAGVVPLAIQALEVARRGENEPLARDVAKVLANFCWNVAKLPRRPEAEYQTALRGIETCRTQEPEDYAQLNTLGVLQYRLGRYADALSTLRRCDEFNSQQNEHGHPTDMAFIAMTYQRLGLRDEARAALVRLRQAMQNEQFAVDEDCRRVAGEAEALLGAEGARSEGGPEGREAGAAMVSPPSGALFLPRERAAGTATQWRSPARRVLRAGAAPRGAL